MSRTRICLYVMVLVPLVVYWQSIFHEYGVREDYAYLNQARAEPGAIVRTAASHGRPLYGALVETTYLAVGDVERLVYLRLASVALLILLALALWRQLFQSGWSEIEAGVIGLGIILLPAAQVVASRASCWPHVLALLLAVAGFASIETELERGGLKRLVALLGGCLIYCLAGLIYQSNVFFAVVPIAAVLLVRTGREPLTDIRWSLVHLSALLVGVTGSYLLDRMMFSSGVFHESARMHLETNPFTKAVWFFWEPLPNALGLYALRDTFNTGAVIFWGAVVLVIGVIWYACRTAFQQGDALARKKWLVCVAAMPLLAHTVSFAAAERAIGYRTIFALSGMVLLLVVYSLRSLCQADRIARPAYFGVLAGIVLVAGWTAFNNTDALVAEPQGNEWEMIRNAVARTTFKADTHVFLVTPGAADRSTSRMFADEFGGLSSDSDRLAQAMFRAAMRDRYGNKLPKGVSYTFASGAELPAGKTFDLVVDMKKLKDLRPR